MPDVVIVSQTCGLSADRDRRTVLVASVQSWGHPSELSCMLLGAAPMDRMHVALQCAAQQALADVEDTAPVCFRVKKEHKQHKTASGPQSGSISDTATGDGAQHGGGAAAPCSGQLVFFSAAAESYTCSDYDLNSCSSTCVSSNLARRFVCLCSCNAVEDWRCLAWSCSTCASSQLYHMRQPKSLLCLLCLVAFADKASWASSQ